MNLMKKITNKTRKILNKVFTVLTIIGILSFNADTSLLEGKIARGIGISCLIISAIGTIYINFINKKMKGGSGNGK